MVPIRSLWLMLCISLCSLCGATTVSAIGSPAGHGSSQTGPARASSTPNKPLNVNVANHSSATTSSAALGSTTYYAAPYFQYGYSNYGPWGSIDAAISAWWTDYQSRYPSAFPGCSFSVTLTDPNTTNNNDNAVGRVAIMPLSGTCGGWGRVVATAYSFAAAKNLHAPCSCAGDPINLGTGEEYRDETDGDLGELSFHRYYNSHVAVSSSHIGAHWRHSFDRSLEYLSDGTTSTATVFRPDGMQVVFTLHSGQWTTDADVSDRLTTQTNASGAITGWLYFDSGSRFQEAYDANGFLMSITNTEGQIANLA